MGFATACHPLESHCPGETGWEWDDSALRVTCAPVEELAPHGGTDSAEWERSEGSSPSPSRWPYDRPLNRPRRRGCLASVRGHAQRRRRGATQPNPRSAGPWDAGRAGRHRSRSEPRPSSVPTSCATRTGDRTPRNPSWAGGASCVPCVPPSTRFQIAQSPASATPSRASTGRGPRLQSADA